MLPDWIAKSYLSISMSGGKDSTALALLAREESWPHVRVFCDTGWESPITYDYLDYLEGILGPIIRLKPPLSFVDRTLKYNSWPARSRRWCTKELKVYPIRDWMRGFLDSGLPDGFADLVNVVGVRADESANRAKMEERQWSDDTDCWVWRPLLRWTLEQVLAQHAKHGVKVNPLYQLGFERVGCFPCIYAGKLELRLIAEHAPERIAEIRDLEQRMHAAKPEQQQTFMALRRPGSPEHIPTPINDAVDWARTKHGGVQFELFPAPSGCARWGLCEVAPKEEGEE